jgi:hypothetical protein
MMDGDKRQITFEKSLSAKRSVLHEERKKLPIYAFCDDFLQAVCDVMKYLACDEISQS